MLGQSLKEQGVLGRRHVPHLSVKEAVLPFVKFHGVDIILGPEMKSTGEVMGIGSRFGQAFAKAEAGAWCPLPDPRVAVKQGKKVFLSVNDNDKPQVLEIARGLRELGFELLCTTGTYKYLKDNGIEAQRIFKVSEGRPNALDCFVNDEVCLVMNTPRAALSHQDELALRRRALERGITYTTTMAAARAALQAMRDVVNEPITVRSLQEYQAETYFIQE